MRASSVLRFKSLRAVDCSPCAIEWFLLSKLFRWNDKLAEVTMDIAISSILVAGVTNVMLPYSLIEFLDENSSRSPHLWNMLNDHQKSITILLRDYKRLESFFSLNRRKSSLFDSVVIPVPSGPISTKLLFPNEKSLHYLYNVTIPRIRLAVNGYIRSSGKTVELSAWMRSSLSCSFEGAFLPPIRISDCTRTVLTNRILNNGRADDNSLGNFSVNVIDEVAFDGGAWAIWEESVPNMLTPRWMETILKTSSACCVPFSNISLSLSGESDDAYSFFCKAVEAPVTSFVTSCIPYPIFPHMSARLSMVQLEEFIEKYNTDFSMNAEDELGSSLSKRSSSGRRETQFARVRKWTEVINEAWKEIQLLVN